MLAVQHNRSQWNRLWQVYPMFGEKRGEIPVDFGQANMGVCCRGLRR